ncbi:MAG: ABC transporter ATP-binding protein [Candidatus Bipolaricaulota bacterium]|nr:ABC transporter ATP-binding protein [Candidatus Bipolaricaulota bacterium]MDW8030968.1 ABC transporter ATP-binding protein [Candidatus Bipolaricaulota bacterium]
MLPAIEVRHVWKQFLIRHNRADSLKERFIGLFNQRYRERCEPFWALRDISFTVEHGEALGLIGPNGSGKSTLLRLIARTLYPTKGEIIVRGRVAPMIELGVGFHHELTGQENIYLNASLYGLTRREIDRVYHDIVEFSELGEFIDVPVKNYSTGMYARLGFSIAVHLDPDILLVDEVLAVGDERFQNKCLEKMLELRKQGKTIVFISHIAEIVQRLCDRACLLMQGRMVELGEVSKIIELYRSAAAPRVLTP